MIKSGWGRRVWKGWQENRLLQCFSSKKGKGMRVQTVGFSNNNIENMKNLGYKVKEPLEFVNGKLLIYSSRKSVLRTLKDYFIYLAAMGILAYMLYNRVNFETYPIVKHIYVASIAAVGVLLARRILRNQNIVKQIYLLEGGRVTEVVFMNQLKRRLFGQVRQKSYYNSMFVEPKELESTRRNLDYFPLDLEGLKQSPGIANYWQKYYSNEDNLLLIPQQYEYMHSQILLQVMNGKIIHY